ncbi:hypothetical protein, partial [Falsiroseomonas oryzae]|uniref:hypothetical protein n=1 Tax=Falsiroseomonas oryzae TaxID=2766473 RepID=UPI0022EB22E3
MDGKSMSQAAPRVAPQTPWVSSPGDPSTWRQEPGDPSPWRSTATLLLMGVALREAGREIGGAEGERLGAAGRLIADWCGNEPRRFFRPPRPPGPPVPPSGPTDLHELGWQARLALGR